MRLLLDEHLSPLIAEALRKRGHDAAAVADDPSLRGSGDDEIFSRAAIERRALLTKDVRDFIAIVRDWGASGRDHYGLLLVSDKTISGALTASAAYIKLLDRLMTDNGDERAMLNRVVWISRS